MADLITEQRLREITDRRAKEVDRRIAQMRKGDLICEVCLMIRPKKELEQESGRRHQMCWCDVEETEDV